ncbi:hypothetical protein O6P43_004023 [Quillaja saponaria]|uniref:Uncharacterized protein n=1 Tax=Quillaja saponaria TaxID=32244 RepID=A0AAD7Q2X0_QUISA|nr:hypothetical protein O6P43_004023 [Quillaja saponaria]
MINNLCFKSSNGSDFCKVVDLVPSVLYTICKVLELMANYASKSKTDARTCARTCALSIPLLTLSEWLQ